MDSTGATARTPRRRSPPWPPASSLPDSPAASSRSLDGAQYGALLPTIRLAADLRDTDSKKLPPRPKPATSAAPASASGAVMKTPRHSYHQRRSVLGGRLYRASATQREEELPIIDNVAGEDGVKDGKAQSGRGVKIAMYGVLNTVILIPVMISFAQIIFRDPAFQPYMTDLIKLVLVSGVCLSVCCYGDGDMNFTH